MNGDNSGPAFPANRDMAHNSNLDHEPGMTMRDYFAAKAMQGELAAMSDPVGGSYGVPLDASDQTLTSLAQHYYRLADAMLAARAKP